MKKILLNGRRGRVTLSVALLVFCLLGSSLPLIAAEMVGDDGSSQQSSIKVTGQVTDNNGEPLPGASIVVKGTTLGITTDFDGKYTISVPNNDATLIFSFIGMKSKEVVVNGQNTINVSLETESVGLNEVVAVGYGTQKKVNLTGAIVSIDSKTLESRGASNVSSILTGQAPGLTILQRGGNPGRNSGSFNIRGIGTLGNSNPLIIVDGVETGSINDLNPEDIANVSILKDAASSAIYGVRAANGVILITTKRGKKNTKMQVTYSQQIGFTDFISLPNKVSSYELAKLHNEANTNDGAALMFSDSDIQKFKDGSSPYTHANTDHVKEIFTESGLWNAHNLKFAGGSDKGAYNISFGYVDEGGIIKNTGLNKYTLRTNFDKEINDRLSVGLNLAGSLNRVKDPGAGIGWITHVAFREWATDPLQTEDGRWVNPSWSNLEHNAKAYASEEMGDGLTRDIRLSGTAFAEYKIIDGLKFKGQVSIVHDNNRSSKIIRGVDLYRINPATGVVDSTPSSNATNLQSDSPSVDKVSRDYYDRYDLNLQAFLNYDKTIKLHRIKALAGFEQREVESELAGLSRRKIASDALDQINAADAGQDDNYGNTTNYKLRSVFGRINYGYDGRYLIEGNLRYDGTSRFAEDIRFDYFPSVSLGWRISEEDFFEIPAVSNLKLRASWGELGNQEIGDYRFLGTYALGSSYIFDNELVSGINEGALANKLISWEKTTSKNIGVDLGLFDNKLSFSAEMFVKDTKDILLTLEKPAILGATPPIENAGAVENKGFEISAMYRDKIGDVNFYISANLSKVKNEITDLAGTDTPGRSVGDPIQNFYGYRTNGLFQSQSEIDGHADQSGLGGTPQVGDVKYLDINGRDANGNLNGRPDGVVNADDRESLGSRFPGINYGISLGADYKNFDVSMVWQGVADSKIMLTGRLQRPFWIGASPLDTHLDSWRTDNTDARFPRASFSNSSNYHASDFWLEDASFLKLRNIQLGYTLPKRWIDNLGLSKLRVFISGENLLTITPFDHGFDPEDVGEGDPVWFLGSNTSENYPTTKRYLAGLILTF
ncbi:TonB-dependent receptor [Puteibacter caeruleilacunae]|nr:TonB-dependent receptor [Puteibacter caeruleilacunae]